MGAFGEKFRKAREKKQLSLDDVANVTKISSRMLQAIEAERFDQLPGGVFNKGFIRAYAKHLELNDQEAVTSYLACLRQAQVDAQEVADNNRPASSSDSIKKTPADTSRSGAVKLPKSRPAAKAEELPDLQLPRAEHVRPGRKDLNLRASRGIPWAPMAVAAVVVSFGLFYWTRHLHSNRAVASIPAPERLTPEALHQGLAPVAPQSAPVAPNMTARTATISAASYSSPSSNSQIPSIHPAAAASTTGSAASGQNASSVPKASVSKTNPDLASPALTLVVRATETTWVSLEADGQPVIHETLIAPARTSVHAAREIVAKVGNAAGVTFLWNGKEIPAQGAESEVKTLAFDAQGVRIVPPAEPATPNQ